MGKDNAWGKAFGMFLFPVVICGLYGGMSVYNSGLLTYNVGGTIYSLGARGYTVNDQVVIEAKFDYATPPTWPEAIRGMPKLLVAHFAIAIVLGVYIVMYATIFAILNADWRKKVPDAGARGKGSGMSSIKEAANQRGHLLWVTPVMLLVLLGLTAADLAMVILAFQAGDLGQAFVPAPAGYGLGITSGVLVVLWTASWFVIRLMNRTKAETEEEKKMRKKGKR